MNCPRCRQPVRAGDRFCAACGAPLPERHRSWLRWGLGAVAGLAAVAALAAIAAFLFRARKSTVPAPALSLPRLIHETLAGVVQITATTPEGEAVGSGFLVDQEGDVLTNAHVVGQSIAVTVETAAGQSYTGTVIGLNPDRDLALVRVPALAGRPPLPMAGTAVPALGEGVAAFGSPLGLRDTVTTGIISGLNRHFHIGSAAYRQMLQISAPIAPGNSGGPLVLTANGRVIGIDTAGVEQSSGNIGFAIPISLAEPLIREWSAHPQSGGNYGQATPSDGSSTASASPFATRAIKILYRFYRDVNAGDFLAAYLLWGQQYQTEVGYATFVAGFANTVHDAVGNTLVRHATADSADIVFTLLAEQESPGGSPRLTVYHMEYRFGTEDGHVRIQSGTQTVVSAGLP